MAVNFVWHCTDQSIENRQVSIAAVVEIVWSIGLYWLVAYYFDTHWHLLSSLMVAPLLLFRSEQSIAQGIEWFMPKDKVSSLTDKIVLLGLALLTLMLIGGILLFGRNAWLSSYSDLALQWRAWVGAAFIFVFLLILMTVVLLVFRGPVGGNNTKRPNLLVALLALPMVSISFFIASTFIRLLATLRYLLPGIANIAENWRENMFIIDPWHPPSLLPGDIRTTVSAFLQQSKASDNFIEKYLFYLFLPLIYIPVLLYRWSIKSTFWFYWPLVYIVNGKLEEVTEKHSFVESLRRHPLELWRLFWAVVTLAILIYSSVSQIALLSIKSTNPIVIFPYLLAIDINAIKPWQWFMLATAILTLLLWIKAWSVHFQYQSAKEFKQHYPWQPVGLMWWLYRLRNLTTWGYLLIGLVFTSLYFPETYHYMPQSWLDWLADFFAMELPIRLGI